jgi:hypothetical protein
MRSRFPLCLAAAGCVAAQVSPAAARPVRKTSAARAAVAAPQEVLTEGLCRYAIKQGGEPQDEVRFLFQGTQVTLPPRGGITPVVVERDYRQDLPDGAPESERQVYAHEVARFDVTPETAQTSDTGLKRWTRPRLSPGMPPGRETESLGLPWLSLPAPRAGLTWERTEALDFPHLRDRFRYRVVGLTTVGGHRAWKIERALLGDPAKARAVKELKTPAAVQQWQETFWVDAAGQTLLRAERRLRLVTTDAQPFELSLELSWTRKATRPLAVAEYRARVGFYNRLADLEAKIREAGARTTLDGASDLHDLQAKVDDLHEGFPQRRYELLFDKLNTWIQSSLENFQTRDKRAG